MYGVTPKTMGDRQSSSLISRAVSVIVSPSTNFALPSSSTTAKDLLLDLAQKSLSPFSSVGRPLPNVTLPNVRSTLSVGVGEQSANRMSYPREFKLLVISYYFQHGQNKYRTCKEFHITKSMLNGWLQKVDKIQQSRPGSLKSGRSGRKPQFPTVEKQLYHVYQACLASGKKVGNRWLRETAKIIAQEQCTPEELNGMCQFSERWLCNFKKRYNINLTKDWNGDTNVQAKSASDGVSYSPTPETCSSPTNCEADSSTSPKKCETPPSFEVRRPSTVDDIVVDDDDVEEAEEDDEKIQIKKSPSVSINVVHKRQSSPPFMKSPKTTASSLKIGFQPYEPGRRGRKVQFPQVEEVLYKNLSVKQSDGVRVSNRWLQDEARRLAVELCPEMFTNAFKSARCMFSEHWLHNFKKRYGISLKQQNLNDAQKNRQTPSSSSVTIQSDNQQISQETLNNIFQFKQQSSAAFNNFWESKNSIATNVVADDLPTMVPLTTLSQSLTKINLAEWYSKISNANNVNECLQMLTDEVRMRKASTTTIAAGETQQSTTM